MRLMEELFCREQKKQTSSLGSLWFFHKHPQPVYHHLYYHLPFFFFFRCFVFLCFFEEAYREQVGCHTQKRKGEFCILSQVVFCLYDIRMTTIIILVLIIILYSHQYLLMKMKWMYLTLYSVNTWNWINFFFIPGEGGARVMSGMSGSSLPQRHYCLGERTSVAFQKSRVWVRNECECVRARVCEKQNKKKCRYLGLWFHFWSFWKVFLFFITGVFTVQIVFMKNPMDTILFFKYKCS